MKMVLLVEDDPLLAQTMVDLVEGLGFQATLAQRLSEAVEQAAKGEFVAALMT